MSFTRPWREPLTRYVALVCAAGFVAAGSIFALDAPWRSITTTHYLFLALLLYFGELMAIQVPRHGDNDEVTTSTTFAFVLLLQHGVGPAVLALVAGSLAADIVRRKRWWKALFNLAQYALSLASAGVVYSLFGGGRIAAAFPARSLPAFMAAATVFFVMNTGLVGIALALAQGIPIFPYVKRDALFQAANAAVLLGLSPIVLLVSATNIILLPLVGFPLWAVYKAATNQLAKVRAEERFRSLVQNSSDVIAIVQDDAIVSYVSPAIKGVLGYDPTQIAGNLLTEFVVPGDSSRLSALCDRGGDATLECRMLHEDGSWRDVEMLAADRREDPSVCGIVLNIRDVTERKGLERDLIHQALHDSLTGLANRALFADRVSHAMSRHRSTMDVVILVLDLDGFKLVNDTFGHAVGDTLLVQAAERLQQCIRTGDTCARLGGDEFGILLEDASVLDGVRLAQRIGDVMRAPFEAVGREVFVSASIGIATRESAGDAGDIIANADMAMYRAKARGKGRHEIFDPEMAAPSADRLQAETDLMHALEHHELRMLYQPIVDIDSKAIVGYEALLRWHHPERGVLPPSEFIWLAEENGMIVPIGRWVLSEACRQIATWRRTLPGMKDVYMSVNLSVRQLENEAVFEHVFGALADAHCEPSALLLEITESGLMSDLATTVERLNRLKRLGVRIAIDDFGTGYSSLSYLRELPVDVLKLDKSFVDGVNGGIEESALARAVVKLGETLQLRVIAEGIETPDQVRELRAMGCRYGQGYLFGKPAQPAVAEGMLGVEANKDPAVTLAL